MAAPVMLMPNSPFAISTAESSEPEVIKSVVPEVTDETLKKLEAASVPVEYHNLVGARYEDALGVKTGLRSRIKVLKGVYRADKIESETAADMEQIAHLEAIDEMLPMPDLNELVDRVVELVPDFEAFKAKGWQPSVDFVPRGLSQAQWGALLRGHPLTRESKSEGTYSTYGESDVIEPYAALGQGSWGVVVSSSTEGPVFRNVSKDGKNGSGAKKAVQELSELPSVTDTSVPEAVIAQASPSRDAYNAVQLGRLMRDEKPLDSETWTIGRENVKVDDSVKSVFLNFYPDDRQVYSGWGSRDYSYDYAGVRPTAER